ncbi:anti-sigma factor domain-containing protein [Oceanobacillus salinisoli]|uniref:anti-sigma factor domain-containing protein n=1 Tax=Oceanobacillus salinisoli TaxID=2678611 RepID=UPI0012E21E15|nr:anti-sigma factor domain-containing protein [Oceanobacillus salinisoli]
MKKGIILEQHRNYTILMTKDGAFEKGKAEGGQIGEEVYFEPIHSRKSLFFAKGRRKHAPAQVLSMACILILLLLPFYLISGANETYAYVTIDINPSIELEIDDNYLVRDIRPMNDDASNVTKELNNYEEKNLETVIQMIMEKSEEIGLINSEKNILVGVSFLNDEMANNEEILQNIESHFKVREPDWNIAAFNVPKDIRELADEQNTSMNEIMASTVASDDYVSLNEWTDDFILDDEEIEIIDSFYNITDPAEEEEAEESDSQNESKEEAAETNLNEASEPEQEEEEAQPVIGKEKKNSEPNKKSVNTSGKSTSESHPSELKSKNGEIQSNGKSAERKNNSSQSSNKKENNGNKGNKENKDKNGNNGNSNQGNGNNKH